MCLPHRKKARKGDAFMIFQAPIFFLRRKWLPRIKETSIWKGRVVTKGTIANGPVSRPEIHPRFRSPWASWAGKPFAYRKVFLTPEVPAAPCRPRAGTASSSWQELSRPLSAGRPRLHQEPSLLPRGLTRFPRPGPPPAAASPPGNHSPPRSPPPASPPWASALVSLVTAFLPYP